MPQRSWPHQLPVKGGRVDLSVWVRRQGTNNMFHIPNSRGTRALCSIKLPSVEEREAVAKPRLWERCRTCERDRVRRETAS